MNPEPLRRFKIFETDEPDDALATLDRLYGKQKYDIKAPSTAFGPTSLSVANLSNLAWVRFKTSYDLTLEKEEPGPCFGLSFPTNGHWQLTLGSLSQFAISGLVGCIMPQDRAVKVFISEGECLSLMIPRSAIQEKLEALIGKPVIAPMEFEPIVDARTSSGGAMLHRSMDMVVQQLVEPDSPLSHPAVAARLEEFIIHILLHGQPHNYRDAITGERRAATPKQVRRAESFIQAHSGETIRLAQIAAAAGCSIRALQLAFRTFRNTTPMTLLKQARLARVHSELSRSDPGAVTVTEIATRYGFYNLGRFAREYRRSFGQSPSETLRLAFRPRPMA